MRRKRKFNKTLLILPVHSPPSEHGAGNVAPSAILTVVDDGCVSSESLVAAERTGIKDVDGSNVTILIVLESSIARLEDGDSTDVTSTVGATIVVACDAWLTEYDGDEATLLTASNVLVTELVVVSATAMDGKTLNVASDARPADRNDCEIDGSTQLDTFDVTALEESKPVVALMDQHSLKSLVYDSKMLEIQNRMTPVAEINDRLRKVNGVTVADIATIVVAPGVDDFDVTAVNERILEVVNDGMTPVAVTSDRLKKVKAVTVAGTATLVVTPEVGAFNVNASEGTIRVVVSDSCFEDPDDFDCSAIGILTVVVVYASPKVNDLDVTTVYGTTVVTSSDSSEARANTFAVTAVDGTTCVIVSDSLLPGVDDFDVTAVNERILEVVNEVNNSDFVVIDGMTPVAETNDRLKKVNGVTLAGIATLVAALEYDNPGLITSEETTFLVPIEVCVEESGKFEVNSKDNPLVALSDVEITEVDDSDVPAVDKNTLEETSDASIADFDGFDVKSDSRLVDFDDFDVSSVERTTLVVVCIVKLTDATDFVVTAEIRLGTEHHLWWGRLHVLQKLMILALLHLTEAFALCDEDNDGVCDTNVEKATAVAICDVCLPVVVRPGSKFAVDDVLFISEPVVEPNKWFAPNGLRNIVPKETSNNAGTCNGLAIEEKGHLYNTKSPQQLIISEGRAKQLSTCIKRIILHITSDLVNH
ncbi:hypothetical protein pdam_00020388 [Pocillopora damicornis]|uniref:Uncharacterized protein n=1 Tax=Pocillopora damicornis TaxID=46731 RepID=A0A3M6V242_POCDA|nr:hypothetical protein pdam_00020388 [Pocillopora damicornis]